MPFLRRLDLMRYVKNFGLFWYDFIVGDDWTVALGVVVGLAITGLLAHQGVAAWWLLPLAVVVLLSLSVWRVAGRQRSGQV